MRINQSFICIYHPGHPAELQLYKCSIHVHTVGMPTFMTFMATRIPRQVQSKLHVAALHLARRTSPTNYSYVRCLTSTAPPTNNNGAPPSWQPQAELTDYLASLGIASEMHPDLLASVRPVVLGTSSSEKDEIVTLAKLTATFQDPNDLVALSHSLAQQQQKKKRTKKRQRPKREVIFRIPAHNNDTNEVRETTLTWKLGESLLDLAQSVPGQQALEEPDSNAVVVGRMEGSCGGQMNCSTCHVYLDPATYQALEPPVEAELDMLDLAFDVKDTSRLGCQVKFNPLVEQIAEDHDIIVTLPSGVNNQWES